MSREQHKRKLRYLKDGNIALDSMTGENLIEAARVCLLNRVGDAKYKQRAEGIVKDSVNERLYVTLPMRRALMGFIRPVFEEENNRRGPLRLEGALSICE